MYGFNLGKTVSFSPDALMLTGKQLIETIIKVISDRIQIYKHAALYFCKDLCSS